MTSITILSPRSLGEASAFSSYDWPSADESLSTRLVLSVAVAQSSEAVPPRPSPALRESLAQITSLSFLPAGWNSYSAKAITKQSRQAAADLLMRHLEPGLRAPNVVPRVQGGLQLEWDNGTDELEIYIEPDGTIRFWAESADEIPFDGPLAGNEVALAQWLRRASAEPKP